MPSDLTVAVTAEVALPEVLRVLNPVRVGEPSRVDTNVLITDPASYYDWLRENPQIPVLALDEGRVITLGLLGARLVPPPNAGVHNLIDLLEALIRVLSLLSGERESSALTWRLSPRERQVLESLATGTTLAATADALGIAETTAKNYLDHARLKLGERDRTAAILKAAEYGLIDWPPLSTDR